MSPHNRSNSKHGAASDPPTDEVEPKARKACINCRRQKMKCRIDSGNSCRRCLRAGQPCVFVPRANASVFVVPGSLSSINSNQLELNNDILRRLATIEECLGLGERDMLETGDVVNDVDVGSTLDEFPEDPALTPLWEALGSLGKMSTGSDDAAIWHKSTIKYLWHSFNENTPGLHFLPDKQRFSAPKPLLLASILYYSSTRGPPDVAQLSPSYFKVLSSAIAQLSVPSSEIGTPPDDASAAEEWAFQTVLAIILAGLLTEGSVRETGIWISIAYRLILEHCPQEVEETSRDWRKLFSGVQIIDLEHASLHMSTPVIPLEPPVASLKPSHRDQLYRLSRMMHTGLAHFTGRGLPTIWSCFLRNPPESHTLAYPFTLVDAAVIRDWARQLDDWLVEFSKASDDPGQDRTPVFRQYVLHRLVVLSIYHPARGCNLHSNSITPNEQHELLLSARATLKLHQNDKAIWSNWDLAMITWAALIVMQGVEGGAGELDDLKNIRVHLEMLRNTNQPNPSLRDTLASCLEQSMQGLQTPSPSTMVDPMNLPDLGSDLDYSWQIFNQASLEQVAFSWPSTELQPSI